MKSYLDSLIEIFLPEVIRVTKEEPSWITENLRKRMGEKDRDKTRHKRNPSIENWEQYRRLSNLTNHEMNCEKSSYYEYIAVNGNSRSYWTSRMGYLYIQCRTKIL